MFIKRTSLRRAQTGRTGHPSSSDLSSSGARPGPGPGRARAGLVHHTNCSSRHASDDYPAALARARITVNTSATGDCFGNAVAESFFASLKAKWLDRHENETLQPRWLPSPNTPMASTFRRGATLTWTSAQSSSKCQHIWPRRHDEAVPLKRASAARPPGCTVVQLARAATHREASALLVSASFSDTPLPPPLCWASWPRGARPTPRRSARCKPLLAHAPVDLSRSAPLRDVCAS